MTELAPDRAAAELYTRRIWRQRQGWAITCAIAPGRGPRHSYYEWPAEEERVLEDCMRLAATADVYCTVLLRDAPSRRYGDSQPLSGRTPWIDADNWSEAQHAQLLSWGCQVWRVASGGGPHRRHVYVDLAEDLPGTEIAQLSRRLSKAFGQDNYGGNNKLLRLPGTFNHKPVREGRPPQLVRWEP